MIEDNFPDLTLPQMLRENGKRYPHDIALRQKDFGIWCQISWSEYYQRALHLGLGLRDLGLSEGGHVAILSENRSEWVISQLGINLMRGVSVGVYSTSPSIEVAYVLNDSDAEIIICEDQEQVDKVLEELNNLPLLQYIVAIDPKGMRSYPNGTLKYFTEIEQTGASVAATDAILIDDIQSRQVMSDTALVVYTSGSTGKPKGAMISYKNIRAQAIGAIDRLGFTRKTSNLSYLPLCHVAEQALSTIAPIYVGSCVSFGESIRTVQEDLRELAPNLFLGVPRIWEKMHASIRIKLLEAGPVRRWLVEKAIAQCMPFAETAKNKRTIQQKLLFALYYLLVFRALQNFIGLRKVKLALTGAAPIPPVVVNFFRTIGIPLIEVYGLTETTGVVTGQTLDHLLPSCVGTQVHNVETRIDKHTGELLLRGDTIFKGYYKNEVATQASIVGGWLHTGDVATNEQGQIKIVDRLKDIMITAGGKNLSPSEIENTVKGSPYIKECIVVGEGRKYVTALIQIDAEMIGKWIEEKCITFTTFKSLTSKTEVVSLVEQEVNKVNNQLPQVAQIKKFHLLSKELDHDDDEMTATMKVRRNNIFQSYAEEIEALYL